MSEIYVTKKGTVVNEAQSQAADLLLKMHKTMEKWAFIDEVVKFWKMQHPDKWASYTSAYENLLSRGELLNEKTGADRTGSMRRIGQLPTELYTVLEFFYPQELTNPKAQHEFLTRFLNAYPMFRIPSNRV